MFHSICARVFGLVACLVLTLGVRAQTNPGTIGTINFVEVVSGAANDTFTAIVVGAIPPGSVTVPPTAVFQSPLQNKLALRFQRRAQQCPEETAIVVASDAVGPVVFIPTENVAGTGAFVEFLDFRFGFPPVTGILQLGSPLNPSALGGPLDLLDDPSNATLYATSYLPNGNIAVNRIVYGVAGSPIVPTLAPIGAFIAPPTPSPFATRMVIDPGSGNLLVPTAGQVDVLNPVTLAPAIASIVVPATEVVATNIAVGFAGGTGQNCIFATVPSAVGTAGGSFFAFSGSISGAVTTAPGVFGPNNRMSFGTNEVAVSAGGPGLTTATFLLQDVVAGPAGNGAIVQVGHGAGPSGAIQAKAPVAIVGTPFNRPQASLDATGTGDPCYFLVSGAADGIGMIGTGASYILGSVATANLPGGAFYDVAHIDRPMSLPGSNEVVVTASPFGVSPSGNILASKVAPAAPPIGVAFATAPAFLNPLNAGTPMMLPQILGAAAPFPALDLMVNGFAGPPATEVLVFGAPLAAILGVPGPGSAFFAPTPLGPYLGLPGGVLTQVPSAPVQPTLIPPFGARRPQFVYSNLILNDVLPTQLVGGFTQLDIYLGLAAPNVAYIAGGATISEITTF